MVHVRLSPMDFGNMRFRSAMEAMAKFLCSHVEYWENFCDIICESYSWSLETYKSELKDWLDVIRKRRCKGSADDEYIERTFEINGAKGNNTVGFVFLPGCDFDFKYFKFLK